MHYFFAKTVHFYVMSLKKERILCCAKCCISLPEGASGCVLPCNASPFQYNRKLPQAIFHLFFYLLSIIFYLEIKMPVKDVHPLQTFLFLREYSQTPRSYYYNTSLSG